MITTTYRLKKKGLLLLLFLSLFASASNAAIFTVFNLNGAGNGSYTKAIIDANAMPGADTIIFTVAGTIMVGSPIPPITDTLYIDGTSAPGYVPCSVPMITLEGNFGGAGNGIQILGGASKSVVLALNVRGFQLNGIMLIDADSCLIQSCTIGVNSSGWSATANGGNGIQIEGGANDNVIGGSGCEGNQISGNSGSGISVIGSTGNDIFGNNIGLHYNGNSAIPNQSTGVYIAFNSHYTSVGGFTANERNVISGNGTGVSGNGIYIENSVGCNIRGNYVGLNVAGTTGIGNAENGISLNNASFTVIGGSSQDAANIIADHNSHGILLSSNSNNCLILGNFCGTNAAGTAVISNTNSGLAISNCMNLTIGGGTTFEKNVFVGSTSQYGIYLADVSDASIYGNFIGTDKTGTINMGNYSGGIRFDFGGGNSIIGGAFGNVSNTIAYNTGYGIAVLGAGTSGVAIRQNSIYCNSGKGIHLGGTGNTNIAAPIITTASTIGCSGTAEPNSMVEIFYDSNCSATCQGKDYVATTLSNGTGAWSLPIALVAGTITATVTDGSNNTSEFAACATFSCANSSSSLTPVVCGSYTSPSGNVWTSSNTYSDTIPNSNGCDSIISIDLTVNAPSASTDVVSACYSYTWINGITYIASNNVSTYTIMNAVGCDSIISLDLTINSESSSTDIISTCSTAYTWLDGNTYTSPNNTATHTVLNSAGCDSVISLDLTFNTSSFATDVISTCNSSYTWIDGNTYTSPNNTATFTTTNAAGCDSIVTLDLSFTSGPSVSLQPFVDVCSNTAFVNLIGASPSGGAYSGPGVNGNTFDPSVVGVGTVNVTYTYTDAQGCVGTATEPITVIPSTTPTLSAFSSVCNTDAAFSLTGGSPAGGSYAGTGVSNSIFDPIAAGAGLHTIVYSFTDANGCTGTVSQDLTVDDCLSLDDLEQLVVTIVPNPAKTFFKISTEHQISFVSLLEVSGREIKHFNAGEQTFNVSSLPTGMYIVRIGINGQFLQRRLVIQ